VADTDWTFGGLWPYEPRWFDTPEGRLHFIDEGARDARPVVLVHGNPTWGFLYRNFVGPLVEHGYRVIVPDFLGFGRSDKPADAACYRIGDHVRRLSALLESLDLHDATVVPQDWGGLALIWAANHPERVAGLFILNTSVHELRQPWRFPLPLRLFRTPVVGEVMVKGLNLFHRAFLFRVGVVHHERLTREVKQAYLAPHPSWSSRTGVLAFPRQIPAHPDDPLSVYLGDVERRLTDAFRDRPVRIVWAMKDVGFTPDMLDELWLPTFPDATVVRLDDAGHYLQEDAHERIVPELLAFLDDAG
jgi:haloalkane dehalogenase